MRNDVFVGFDLRAVAANSVIDNRNFLYVMCQSAICEGKIFANNSMSVLEIPNIASFLVGEHTRMFLSHRFSHWARASQPETHSAS